ncbi:hypothetical protein ACQEU3_44610 [Spirillospora sp. CA-253888]
MTTPDLPELHVLLEKTDWANLDGPFQGDPEFPLLPVLVDRLLNGSAAERHQAFEVLSEQINHAGGVYEITAAALPVLAALLPDRRLDGAQIPRRRVIGQPGGDRPPQPLRAAVLELMWSALQEVDDHTVEVLVRRHRQPEWVQDPEFQQVRALRPALLPVALEWWQDPDPQVRLAAAALAVPVLEAPELAEHRPVLVPQVHAVLAAGGDPDLGYAVDRAERLRYAIGPAASGDHATVLGQGFDLAAVVTAAVAAADPAEIWKVVRWFAETWLVPLGRWDGCDRFELDAAEERLGVRLPTALRQAHALLGRRDDLLGDMHRLESLEGLHLVTADVFPEEIERLVFRTENQGRWDWGIRLTDLHLDDPPVLMTGQCDGRCSVPDDCAARGVTVLERTSWAVLEAVLDESRLHAAGVHNTRIPADQLAVVQQAFTRLGLPDQPAAPVPPCAIGAGWYTGTDVLVRAEGWGDQIDLTLIGRTLPALEAAAAKLPDGWFPGTPWTSQDDGRQDTTPQDLSRCDLSEVEKVSGIDIPATTMAQIVAVLDAHHRAHSAPPSTGLQPSDAADCDCPDGDEEAYYLGTEHGLPVVYYLGRFRPADHHQRAPAAEHH